MQCLTQQAGQTVFGIYKGMKLNALVAMVTVTYEKQPRKNMPSMCVCVCMYIYYIQGLVNPRPENQDQWNGRET